jgi:arylsulfatase A-like enzyme
MLPYEETTRIPVFIRTPWAATSKTSTASILNIDFAPTLLSLVGYTETPSFMDGVSVVSELMPKQQRVGGTGAMTTERPKAASPRTDFLIEYWPIPGGGGYLPGGNDVQKSG